MNASFKKIGFSLVAMGTLSMLTYTLPIGVSIATEILARYRFKPPLPPNRGIAGNRSGAASRISNREPIEESSNSNRRLTALVPEYKNSTDLSKFKPELTKVWGLTANEHPTLWFYSPYAQDAIARIDFVLREGDNSVDSPQGRLLLGQTLRYRQRVVYQSSIQAPKNPGIMNVALPETSESLAIDKLYQWELKLTMKRQRDRVVSVKGWIQRVNFEPQLSDRIDEASPTQAAALYAENGLWYDALSTLATLKQTRSQDSVIQQDWKNLLKSVDLGRLANKPFVK
jgi:Domain of Unknown Function (DUF928)